jgi:hypothetical protein
LSLTPDSFQQNQSKILHASNSFKHVQSRAVTVRVDNKVNPRTTWTERL